MFSYFGSKSKLINRYSPPCHDLIIEPFAGSARYALKYFDRQVVINDLSPTISNIWLYLTTATPEEIKALPELQKGESLDDCQQLAEVERHLLGFAVNRGCASPRKTMTQWCFDDGEIPRLKKKILHYLPRIAHWKVYRLCYTQLINRQATWFVDPPYQGEGFRYPATGAMDFAKLGAWCQSRNGQTIVCESGQANWLPFVPLCENKNMKQHRVYTELVWNSIRRKRTQRKRAACPAVHSCGKMAFPHSPAHGHCHLVSLAPRPVRH